MRLLKNVLNAGQPTADYPQGKMVNKSAGTTGTSINEDLLNDLMVTIEKIKAESGVTPNNLPDNVTNGWQLLQALNNTFGSRSTQDNLVEDVNDHEQRITVIENEIKPVGNKDGFYWQRIGRIVTLFIPAIPANTTYYLDGLPNALEDLQFSVISQSLSQARFELNGTETPVNVIATEALRPTSISYICQP